MLIRPMMLRGAGGGLRPQDVFATSLYSGTAATKTVTNGLNLAGLGGLVWIKRRDAEGIGHALYDTLRGVSTALRTELTNSELFVAGHELTAFGASGFTVLDDFVASVNTNPGEFLSWSFVRKPKFFDVVTYTGDGTSNRQISHNLGIAPGMVIVKRRDRSGDSWFVYHIGLGIRIAGSPDRPWDIWLNDSYGRVGADAFGVPTSINLVVGQDPGNINASGGSYVAYVIAHDPDPNGIVRCGSYTASAGGNATITLPWPVQFALTKQSSVAGDWNITDTTRGMTSSISRVIKANTSNVEAGGSQFLNNGNEIFLSGLVGNSQGIFLAVRAPI